MTKYLLSLLWYSGDGKDLKGMRNIYHHMTHLQEASYLDIPGAAWEFHFACSISFQTLNWDYSIYLGLRHILKNFAGKKYF